MPNKNCKLSPQGYENFINTNFLTEGERSNFKAWLKKQICASGRTDGTRSCLKAKKAAQSNGSIRMAPQEKIITVFCGTDHISSPSRANCWHAPKSQIRALEMKEGAELQEVQHQITQNKAARAFLHYFKPCKVCYKQIFVVTSIPHKAASIASYMVKIFSTLTITSKDPAQGAYSRLSGMATTVNQAGPMYKFRHSLPFSALFVCHCSSCYQ